VKALKTQLEQMRSMAKVHVESQQGSGGGGEDESTNNTIANTPEKNNNISLDVTNNKNRSESDKVNKEKDVKISRSRQNRSHVCTCKKSFKIFESNYRSLGCGVYNKSELFILMLCQGYSFNQSSVFL